MLPRLADNRQAAVLSLPGCYLCATKVERKPEIMRDTLLLALRKTATCQFLADQTTFSGNRCATTGSWVWVWMTSPGKVLLTSHLTRSQNQTAFLSI